MKAQIRATATLNLERATESEKATMKSAELALNIDGLDRDQYFEGHQSNALGCQLITKALTMGLVANIHRAHQKGWRDSAEHLRAIIDLLETGFVDTGTWTDSDPPLRPEFLGALRKAGEIQDAHDWLSGIVQGGLDLGLSNDVIRAAHASLDTLCWVLSHDNKSFGNNLEALKSLAQSRGFRMGPRPNV